MTAADGLKEARRAIVDAAVSVAEDVAAGRVSVAALDAVAAQECQALFATVIGPDDPLWGLHVEVARQVLALDGIPVDELAEWLAVTRAAQGVEAPAAEPGWIESTLAQLADFDPQCDGKCATGECVCPVEDEDDEPD